MERRAIDLQGYFPFFVGTIANRWTATSSRLYLDKFGIGMGEWRVLAAIRALGTASSLEVVNLISMDPGAVSRSMARLQSEGLVKPVQGKFAGRTKPYELTPEGIALHARVSDDALRRENLLLADLNAAERATLLSFMRKVMGRLEDL